MPEAVTLRVSKPRCWRDVEDVEFGDLLRERVGDRDIVANRGAETHHGLERLHVRRPPPPFLLFSDRHLSGKEDHNS